MFRRVQKFRVDYTELRGQFEKLRGEAAATVSKPLDTDIPKDLMLEKAAENNRAELMSGASTLPMSPSDARRRLQPTNSSTSTLHPGLRPQGETISESPFRSAGEQGSLGSRESYALDEHSFIQNAETRLDDFIAQGREVLDNLVDQRNMLKGTQRRLLDAANKLGLSRDVISWIEKRRFVSPI